MILINRRTTAISLLLIAAASSQTEAISVSGKLGVSTAAADSYTFTCPTGTAVSRVRIMDLNTTTNRAAAVIATFGERAILTRSVSDTEASPLGSANVTNTSDGPGVYNLVVNKSALGVEDYTVTAECLNSAGAVLPASLLFKTDQ